jgi:hypothetical protein
MVMGNKIGTSFVALLFNLSLFAGYDMVVKLSNGDIFKFDTDEVEEVVFEENLDVGDVEYVYDASEIPLEFNVLSNSTVEVVRDVSYNYQKVVRIPEKVRIDGKIYSVVGIADAAFFVHQDWLKWSFHQVL